MHIQKTYAEDILHVSVAVGANFFGKKIMHHETTNASFHPRSAFRLRPLAFALAALPLFFPAVAQAQGGITNLGALGGTNSGATSVSLDGAVVVGASTIMAGDQADRAFLWTQDSGMINLGTLGGTHSEAHGVSADGAVVVGGSDTTNDEAWRAFRWTRGSGMVDLGTLGGPNSYAHAISSDGTVVVGWADKSDMQYRAFRWTQDGGMEDLGTLGGLWSVPEGVSADGAVVVGASLTAGNEAWHAFRWTQNTGMVNLGGITGRTNSQANGVSADGAVVVGGAFDVGRVIEEGELDYELGVRENVHAFRWTQDIGMVDLGTLGGAEANAHGVSGDGAVVVGWALTPGGSQRAFRWTQDASMQSVEDWLRDAGVAVPVDITRVANATNVDGSVVVGTLASGQAFIARVADSGSGGNGGNGGNGGGLITLQDLQQSLADTSVGGGMALSAAVTVLNGAHSRPLSRRVDEGQRAFWLAGDWGRDGHGARSGDLGLAEVGFGKNFGAAQVNVSLGQTWAKQDQAHNGRTKTAGTYVLAQALIPVSGNLWGAVGAYVHRGEADMRRGYLNAGAQDYSRGTPNVNTWGLRARLEWDQAWHVANADVLPYVDLSHAKARLAAYTETSGGFPARFDSRKEKATELRLGVNAAKLLGNGLNLIGMLEAAHRFEKSGPRSSGQVIGLSDFGLDGRKNDRNWLRLGVGVEGKLAGGRASLMLNATTKGETSNAWLAANWQHAF